MIICLCTTTYSIERTMMGSPFVCSTRTTTTTFPRLLISFPGFVPESWLMVSDSQCARRSPGRMGHHSAFRAGGCCGVQTGLRFQRVLRGRTNRCIKFFQSDSRTRCLPRFSHLAALLVTNPCRTCDTKLSHESPRTRRRLVGGWSAQVWPAVLLPRAG